MTSLVAAQDPRWLALLDAQRESHVFHHPAWLDLVANAYGYRVNVLAQVDANGCLTAGLPLAEIKSPLTGRRFVALPYTDYTPLLGRDSDCRARLAGAVEAWWQAAGRPRLEVRWELPGAATPHVAAVLHELDLTAPCKQLQAGFSKMHQRNIRKAEKDDVRVETDTSLDGLARYYQLHLLTRRRLGVPTQPWRFFRSLWERLIAQGLGFVQLAYLGKEAIAGAVFLHWQQTLVYKYGASDTAFLAHRPNHLIFWTTIQWGQAQGLRRLDFGRTDLDNVGLREFKSGWGAAERPLIYSYLGDTAPQLSTGLAGRALSRVIRSSPPVIGRVLGELLYGHFV